MRDKFVKGKLSRRDPIRYSKTNKAYLNFSLSISTLKPGLDPKDRDVRSDYKNYDTVFHNCVVFGDLAEAINALELKSKIAVIGDEETQTWKDRQTGQDRSKVVIMVKDAFVSLARGPSMQSDRGAYTPETPDALRAANDRFSQEQDIPY